jgi:hypothetical protein
METRFDYRELAFDLLNWLPMTFCMVAGYSMAEKPWDREIVGCICMCALLGTLLSCAVEVLSWRGRSLKARSEIGIRHIVGEVRPFMLGLFLVGWGLMLLLGLLFRVGEDAVLFAALMATLPVAIGCIVANDLHEAVYKACQLRRP